ncbi:lipopolysaccharide transport periplasmic protein LptA [Thiomicrospira sp. ALE5]|uniref:lipopolysaccharide transport periplasmic protein LptA n=1 Tax=Thiomicrospira sp. ALE5 TaxID=748650 RepID=UPI001F33ADD1|nr:lipopolysaccharide transport periplasmic protein LptA [Thiomicrospira sp. ALE5]
MITLAPSLYAQSTNQQPITIEANQLDAFDQIGESHYQGEVLAQRGNITIRGENLVVFHPQRVINRLVTNGQPAQFEMQNNDQGQIKGQAEQIVYYVDQEIAHLIGNAFVDQDSSQSIRAGLIIIDLNTMTMQASGNTHATDQTPEKQGRVEMIFTPGNQN